MGGVHLISVVTSSWAGLLVCPEFYGNTQPPVNELTGPGPGL